MFQEREQYVQRPRGRKEVSMLNNQRGREKEKERACESRYASSKENTKERQRTLDKMMVERCVSFYSLVKSYLNGL